MSKTKFHDIKDSDIPSLVKDSHVVSEVDVFTHKGVTSIPLFRLWHDYKWNLDGRRWKGARASVNIIVGNEVESFIVFTLQNKHNEELRFALPAGAFVTLLPVIMYRNELYLTGFGKKTSTKGDREKNVIHVRLNKPTAEVFRLGAMLFMEKAGMLNDHKRIVAEEMTKAAKASLGEGQNEQTVEAFEEVRDILND